MKSGKAKCWMLAAALATGVATLGATTARAAEVAIYIGAPAAVLPACPGPGYLWMNGYRTDGLWVPGHWEFRGADRGMRNWDRRDRFAERWQFDERRGPDRWERGRAPEREHR